MKTRSALRTAWTRWRQLARKAGNFQARVFLTVFYFTLAAPFGLIAGRFGTASRPRTGDHGPTFDTREMRPVNLVDLRRQF